MKIGVIIQSRTSSTRLPNKILKELPFGSGITVLQQVLRRVKKSKKIDDIIVATTTDVEDDKIVNIAKIEKVKCYRGSKKDVLERTYLTAKEHNLDIIVRITSDCPCIDADIIDLAIYNHLKTNADYTTNTLTRTFPHGLDTEVISFFALEKSHLEAKKDFEREHVCPFIHTSHPDKFKITQFKAPTNLYGPQLRITLDRIEDYILLSAIYDYLYSQNNFFKAQDIIRLFKQKKWLCLINQNVVQKKILESFQEEIKEAINILDLQGLKRVKTYLTNKLEGD